MDFPPDPQDGFHTGSMNPGTGGVRDTYKPNMGSLATQAEYTAQLEREAAERKKNLLVRIWRAVRQSVWGT